MGRLITLGLLIAMGVSMTSCNAISGLFNRGEETGTSESGDGADESDVAADGTTPEGDQPAEDAQAEDELFQESGLPGLPGAASFEAALNELIRSTDPTERLQAIERERSDPYAYVPVPPPPPPAVGPPASNGELGQNADSDTEPPNIPTIDPITPGPIEEPPPEPPIIASQVEVSGVAHISGELYAIIKAPQEDTSRYVREGDLISNGTILVKRIETDSGGRPVVIFQERGREIARPVGSGTGGQSASAAFQGSPVNSSEIAVLVPPPQQTTFR